jgi:hypothetical protein
MAYLKTLDRSHRIRMFLDEYYLGYSGIIRWIRIIGGPLLLVLCYGLWSLPSSPWGIAYAGICFFYGFYYTLKPFLWILLREDSFQTIHVNIEVNEDTLKLVDDTSESEIKFNAMRRVLKRKSYYMLEVAKFSKVYLPVSLLSEGQCRMLDQQLRDHLQARSTGNLI